MGVEVDFNLDEDELLSAMEGQIKEHLMEKLETEYQEGYFECDCGSTYFDITTWQNQRGEIQAAGVCRECNERTEIDVDISGL